MSHLLKPRLFAAIGTVVGCMTLLPPVAAAREVQSLEEMRAMVRQHVPAFLANPGEVVEQVLAVPLAPPLSRSFDQRKALDAVFGSGAVSIAPDCRRRGTAAGEPDQGDCVAANGREAGKGAYTVLRYSKNLGNGNIKYLARPPVDDDVTPDELPTAKLTDAEALDRAMAFLQGVFGLPLEEIPTPPDGVKSAQVRSLAIAGASPTGGAQVAPIVVQKVVMLRRGFPLAKPFEDPSSGMVLSHVPGPGEIAVAVDDTGVVGASVAGWRELRRDPQLSARNAKSLDTLIDEISEDLFNSGVRDFDSLNFQLQVGADWRGAFGLLVPTIEVSVATVPHDLSEEEQAKLAFRSTAGVVNAYSLVERPDSEQRQ